MRTSRGWPVAALLAVALLCVMVAVCADPTGTAPPAGAGRAVDDEGGELAMMAADSEGADTVFDPFTPRLALAISADDALLPDAPVTLTVSGEAREAIDGGEVVVMLPTKAAMDYAGAGRQPYYKTQYSAHYVMKVFATCEVKIRRTLSPFADWQSRNDVSDFVWCLENRALILYRWHPGTWPPRCFRWTG